MSVKNTRENEQKHHILLAGSNSVTPNKDIHNYLWLHKIVGQSVFSFLL